MPSLYEISQNMMLLQDMLELGEIDEQTYNDTVGSMGVEDKLEAICMVMRNLEAKAEAYKVEADRMTAKRRTIENSIRRLKDSILTYMVTFDFKKVNAGLFTVGVGRSKSVNVIDPSMIPEEYLIPQPAAIDKKAIAKALKEGERIAGTELAENPYVTIR